jgi:hypothetical protein
MAQPLGSYSNFRQSYPGASASDYAKAKKAAGLGVSAQEEQLPPPIDFSTPSMSSSSTSGSGNVPMTDLRRKQLARRKLEAENRANKAAGGGTGNRAYNNLKGQSRDLTGGIYDIAGQGLGQITPDMFQAPDFSQLPTVDREGLEAQRLAVEDNEYARLTRDFGEDRQKQQEELENSLIRRGINPGSGELWNNELTRVSKDWDRREQEARQNARSSSLGEFQNSYNMQRQNRSDAMSEAMLQKGYPIQQLGGLLGLGQMAYSPYRDYTAFQQALKQQELANKGRGGAYDPYAGADFSPLPTPF